MCFLINFVALVFAIFTTENNETGNNETITF